MNKLISTILLMTCAVTSLAQDSVKTNIGADIVSRYIWRGLDLGNTSVQPTLGISYGGLSLNAWGSMGLTEANDTKELDLTLSYTTGCLNVGVTDYWFSQGNYFTYTNHETTHVIEANVGVDLGVASLQWFTNVTGDDGMNKSGDRAFSSYVEASVPFQIGGCDWAATIGAVPYATTFYDTNGFAVTNISLRATKEITAGKNFSIPVFAGITANPRAEKMYMVFGATLAL